MPRHISQVRGRGHHPFRARVTFIPRPYAPTRSKKLARVLAPGANRHGKPSELSQRTQRLNGMLLSLTRTPHGAWNGYGALRAARVGSSPCAPCTWGAAGGRVVGLHLVVCDRPRRRGAVGVDDLPEVLRAKSVLRCRRSMAPRTRRSERSHAGEPRSMTPWLVTVPLVLKPRRWRCSHAPEEARRRCRAPHARVARVGCDLRNPRMATRADLPTRLDR